MVRGIEIYKEYFSDYSDHYVIIGGTACDIIMNNIDADFRATKDFDVVLIAEAFSEDFFRKLWQFISDGGYKNKQKSSGKEQFFRFDVPKDGRFPVMIELFSREPFDFNLKEGSALTPIPAGEDIPSLSAILLDKAYYNLLLEGNVIIDGVSVLSEECLILYKIKAWLDLRDRKEIGEHIDSKNIKKHKNDVFKLLSIVSPTKRIAVNETIIIDIDKFLELVKKEPVEMKDIGITVIDFNQALRMIGEIYIKKDKSIS